MTTPNQSRTKQLQSVMKGHLKRGPTPMAPPTTKRLRQELTNDAASVGRVSEVNSEVNATLAHTDHAGNTDNKLV